MCDATYRITDNYKSGIVKESLRLSYGAPGRLPRVVPSMGSMVAGRKIPAGTTVSHSNYLYHNDEEIWKSPSIFMPQRWMGSDSKALEHRLLSFSRGSRACLGIQ